LCKEEEVKLFRDGERNTPGARKGIFQGGYKNEWRSKGEKDETKIND